MTSQIDFARETRRLEHKYEKIRKEFLIFANQKTAESDITDEEKFRLLSAFLGDYASDVKTTTGRCYVTMNLPEHLADLHDKIEKDFELFAKLDLIDYEMWKNDQAFAEWDKANSPKSPLLQ